MSQQSIKVDPGTGSAVDFSQTSGGNFRQAVTIGDPSTDANYVTVANGAANVVGTVSISNSPSVTIGASSNIIGTVSANQVGAWNVNATITNSPSIVLSSGSNIIGTVFFGNAVPSGSNTIGTVFFGNSVPAGSNTIGTVTISPTGVQNILGTVTSITGELPTGSNVIGTVTIGGNSTVTLAAGSNIVGTVTIGSLAAGSNVIGTVTIGALSAGSNVIGTVFMGNSIPAGSNVIGTMGATQIGTWTVQPGNTANTTAWLTQVSAGTITNLSAGTVAATQSGSWSVTALAGNNLIGTVGIVGALPAGTNALGSVTLGAASNIVGSVTVVGALPSGGNIIGTMTAISSGESGTMFNGTTPLTPTFSKISFSGIGTNVLLGSVSSKRIRVVAMSFLVSTATNLYIGDSNGGMMWGDSTNPGNFAANSGIVLPYCPVGYFQTGSGNAMIANISTTSQVAGAFTYVQI